MRALEHMSTAIWIWVEVNDYRLCKYCEDRRSNRLSESLVNRRADQAKETKAQGRVWFMVSSSWKCFQHFSLLK